MALARPFEEAPARPTRRRTPAQVALFSAAELEVVDPREEEVRGGPGLIRRVEEAEAQPAVRETRMFRLVSDPDPRLGWLIRFAVGAALSSACDPACPRGFPLRAATRALGDRLGAPVALLQALDPLLTRGVLYREDDGALALVDGLESWLLGDAVTEPGLAPMAVDTALRQLPEIRSAAHRLAPLLEPGQVVVLRSADPLLAHAFAECVSEWRGRGLQAWAHDGVEPAGGGGAVRAAAAASRDDLLISLAPRDDNPFQGPCGANWIHADQTGGEGLVFVVLDPDHAYGDPLLGVDPVIDLRPLSQAVERALQAASAAGLDRGGTLAERLSRAEAIHRALYPDIPVSDMAPLVPAAPLGDRDPSGDHGPAATGRAHVAAECWQLQDRTLEHLVLPNPVRAAFDAVVAAGREGHRSVVLLHGPPGTGKSMAARCLAGSLGRPLYRLQGGVIRGQFFGQMERRLTEVFLEAERRRAVLLIDEADEWLGRRQGSAAQVGGASIQQSSEMLQLLEHFNGVAVLTTNRSEVLDPALSRRVDAWIHLCRPGMEERMALWALALGDRAPLSPVDLLLLTAVALTGGEIQACVNEAAVTGTGFGTPALLASARRRSERSALAGD